MINTGVEAINEKVRKESAFVKTLLTEMEKVIVGQKYLLERLLVGLLANGHILIEGVPGLAKTTLVSTVSPLVSQRRHSLFEMLSPLASNVAVKPEAGRKQIGQMKRTKSDIWKRRTPISKPRTVF